MKNSSYKKHAQGGGIMSQTTKRALASSLKKLLKEKPLDKITIVDIVEDCEVNRQTFYYHFQDIYDLIEWIYTSEALKVIGDKKTYATWQEGYLHIFEYVEKNKDFVLSTYHSVSREHLESFLYKETYQLLWDVVEELAKQKSVRAEDKAFIADFYKYGFVGLILDWISKGMKEDPVQIINRLDSVIHGDIDKALHEFDALS